MKLPSLPQAWRASGLPSVAAAGPDAWLLIAARTGRMVAYGASALVLALFFAALDVSDARIGLFMTLTLAGDVGLSLVLSFVADHLGRRRVLLGSALLMLFAGVVFATCENYWLLLLAAVVGVLSATGGDNGPFRAIEEAMLSEITTPTTRADVLAWYVTTSTLGSSVGTELAGRALQALGAGDADADRGVQLRAYHACFWAYAAMGGVNVVLFVLLSKRTELGGGGQKPPDPDDESIRLEEQTRSQEPPKDEDDNDNDPDDAREDQDLITGAHVSRQDASPTTPNPPPTKTTPPLSSISAQTRRVMYGLWLLLMLDALADGMASMALTTYYLDASFAVGKDSLGHVVSAAYFLAACSSALAGPLVRALGLVRTMVFTHVPSSAAVLLFPVAKVWGGVPLAYFLLILRVALNNLDQAPRTALLAAVVRPAERTAVLGMTSLLRTVASTAGPSFTGLLAGHGHFGVAFVVAGALRLAYDFGLFACFLNIRLFQYEGGDAAAGGAAEGAPDAADDRLSLSSDDSGSTVHDERTRERA